MILMKIQFILEAYVYTHGDKDWGKKCLWSLFLDRIDMSPGFMPLRGCKLLSETLESSA